MARTTALPDSRLSDRGRLVVATRGSPLALAQATAARALIATVAPGLELATEVMRTTGDRFLDRPLAEIGGKGLFTKELDEALLAGRADVAVHSVKDLPTRLPAGLVLAAMLEREDPRDVLVAHAGRGNVRDLSVAGLAREAVIGTASLRRGAVLRHARPDLRVVMFRGNVQTRLRKLAAGEADATLLALAGLKRLGMIVGEGELVCARILSLDEMMPAPGQGAVGLVCRETDEPLRALLAGLDHRPTSVAVAAERAALAALDGSCRTPIAAHGALDGERLTLAVEILTPDGARAFRASRAGAAGDAARLGDDAGRELRERAGPNFFAGAA